MSIFLSLFSFGNQNCQYNQNCRLINTEFVQTYFVEIWSECSHNWLIFYPLTLWLQNDQKCRFLLPKLTYKCKMTRTVGFWCHKLVCLVTHPELSFSDDRTGGFGNRIFNIYGRCQKHSQGGCAHIALSILPILSFA